MLDLLQFGSPRLTDLISADLNYALARLGRDVSYSDGQLIHSRGDDNRGISIVREGAVRIGVIGIDGSFITTSIFGVGQCIGEFTLFAGLPRTHDVSALGECTVQQIPAAPFLALFDSEPELAQALLHLSLLRTHSLLEFSDDFRRLPKQVHVAKFLLQVAESAADPAELQCLQEELAYIFGVSRVSMGKFLKSLQSEGLILLGYRKIRIPDLPLLRAWVSQRTLVAPLAPKARS